MIQQVIDDLGEVVADATGAADPVGYFAALYRAVTIRVRDGIEAGDFEDGPRMEALDERFARRYLDALADHRAGRPVLGAWTLAFESTEDWWPIVLQHLLLGMNAHINLDLGIAAARVAPGPALPALRSDFDTINEILASLVDRAQMALADTWPMLHLLDHTAAKTDEAVVNFAMERARDHAWMVAERLAPLPLEEQDPVIRSLDASVTAIGRRVRHPGPWIGTVLRFVRLGELGGVRRKTESLERIGG